MVKLISATFGDEFGSTDVSSSLANRVKDGGIDVYVDSSLIPVVDKAVGTKTTKLSPEEETDLRDTVAQMCGPADQTCMAVKTEELAQAKLKEKEAVKTASTAQVIKGRRLTVEYEDANGVRRKAVVPEGQQFQVNTLGKEPDKNPPVELEEPAWKQIVSSWWGILGTFVATFLYAASIVVTWMTYDRYGSKIIAGVMTAISVFIPFSGFGLAFFGPFIAEYFRVDKLARLQATVPEEVGAIAKAAPGLIPAAPALPDMAKGVIPAKGGLRRILSGRK
jgi:hypothetical protein